MIRRRLSLSILLGLALVPRLAGAQAQFRVVPSARCDEGGSWRDERYCEVREAVLPAGGQAIRVDAAPNGGVRVEGWDRNEVRVRAKVVAQGDTEAEARATVAEVRIETSPTIKAESLRGSDRHRWSVSFELSVPRNSDLSLTSFNGGISIADVHGSLEFQTTNGGVSLVSVSGRVNGHTTNGGVKVRLDGAEWAGDGLDVKTTNGGVNLDVPENYNAHLETGTVNGGLRIDFPVMVQGRIDKQLSVDLGHGGRTIRVVTTNGGVVVRKQ
jgi:DUF4097 and DUF4098 domain-containing protein YvlB